MFEPDPFPLKCPRWLERCFCFLLLALKGVHFWRARGILIGYDVGDHLQRYGQTDWGKSEPPLREFFYAYHPPLGFLLPHFFQQLGLDGVGTLQLFGTICGSLAFLGFRGVLGHLRLVQNGLAVGFLYLWAAIPILINCDVSLNLDVIVLAWFAGVLYCSVRLFAGNEPKAGWENVTWSAGIVLMLAGAMMTKFSGLLLFAVPPLVGIAFHAGKKFGLIARLLKSSGLLLLTALLVLPYYQQRYWKTEHTFFPRNQDWWMPAEIEKAAAIRDRNRLKYFAQLLAPEFSQPTRPQDQRATDVQRYSDVWKDFWVRDSLLDGEPDDHRSGDAAIQIGLLYRGLLTALCLAGCIVWLRTQSRGIFDRLGAVLLLESALFIGAHLIYCYRDATALFGVTKGIYILPATAGAAFIAVQSVQTISSWPARWQGVFRYGAPLGLFAWMLINYLLPVY